MVSNEKWHQYATILEAHISKIFTDDCETKIDLSEFNSQEHIHAFFYALSIVVPCSIFNRILDENKDHLQFSHVANYLCFEHMKK